ncbi:MAG TPA: DUF6036 family nucleotidyltransferase [Myxococcota bacterium]|nr:DUF6036 family nucleotidyltransferase [Myxococcota bacterium]
MKKYSPAELKTFLEAIDRNLENDFTMIIIGGCAAALAYKVDRHSLDIDTINDTSEISQACQVARKETGLNVPVGAAGIADPPCDYEDRLQPLKIDGIKRLQIFVPEKHDLALMKIVRGDEHDIETIAEIAGNVGLDYEILVNRFQKEMGQAIGRPETLKLKFLVVIERVFGGDKACEAAEKLNV